MGVLGVSDSVHSLKMKQCKLLSLGRQSLRKSHGPSVGRLGFKGTRLNAWAVCSMEWEERGAYWWVAGTHTHIDTEKCYLEERYRMVSKSLTS